MPYTGNETKKPKCSYCGKDMTFIMTDPKSKLGGYTCETCDGMGRTHKIIGGQ